MQDFTLLTCFVMRSAMKKIDRYVAGKMEGLGISIPQSFVLSSLLLEDGSTLKEIGTKAQIDSSSMTVLVDKLENEGLVERKLDCQDRRAIRVFLTAKGREMGEQTLQLAEDFNQQLAAVVGDVKEPFDQGLKRIIDGLD